MFDWYKIQFDKCLDKLCFDNDLSLNLGIGEPRTLNDAITLGLELRKNPETKDVGDILIDFLEDVEGIEIC